MKKKKQNEYKGLKIPLLTFEICKKGNPNKIRSEENIATTPNVLLSILLKIA